MGFSMLTKIIREDIVSSLTGGFYLDYQQTHFVNIVHFYLWILFLISPLVVYLLFPESLLGGICYSCLITLVVASIKLITWRLHRLLDLNVPITQTPDVLLLSSLNARNSSGQPAPDNILSDAVCEEVSANYAQDIEERCRRIGQAGLAMVELGEAFNAFTDSNNQFPSSCTQNGPHSTVEENQGYQKDESFCHIGARQPYVTVYKAGQGPSTPSEEQKAIDEPKDATTKVTETMDNYSEQLSLSRNDGIQDYSVTSGTVTNNGAVRSSPRCHKTFEGRIPLVRPVPVRRQRSSTAVLLYPTEPSTSSKSSMDGDLERCKRIISQLEADVNRLPVGISEPFTPSVKDLEVLKTAAGKSVTTHARSHSQRYRRALLASQLQPVRQQAIHLPSSLFSRQTIGPAELTELSLADTILYWRRHFSSHSAFGSNNRTLRSQSLRQPVLTSGRAHRMETDILLNRLAGRRSYSLRYSHSVRNQLSTGYRNLRRRPGSALKLRHQQSLDSAFGCHTKPSVASDWNRLKSSEFSIRKTVPNVETSGNETTEERNTARRRKAVILKVPSADSEFIGPLFETDVAPYPLGDIPLELQKPSEEPTEFAVPTSVPQKATERFSTNALDVTGNSTETPASDLSHSSFEPRETRFVRRTGLVRQYGFRRKFTVVPTHKGDSVLLSNSSEVVEHMSASPSVAEQSGSHAIENGETQLERGSLSSTLVPGSSTSAALPSVSSPCASSVSTTATVDFLLAQLMGVQSLSDAGLTRQQCLAQLRGGLEGEDSENAELDILFALTAAATGTGESNPTVERRSDESALTYVGQSVDHVEEPRTQGRQQAEPPELVTVPSISFLRRAPYRMYRATDSEPSNLSPDNPDDVQPTHCVESRASTRSRRSFLQTRPFLRTCPLSRNTRVRTQPKQVYIVRPIPILPITIRLCIDRLQLDALFDRNRSVIEPVLSVILSLFVGIAGISVLQTGVYRDLSVLSLCFAIAGSHYSLIKSVQPDPASPQHGFNRVIVYSRATFFCFLALIFILTARFHDAFSTELVHSSEWQSGFFFSVASSHKGELSLIDQTLFSVESPLLTFDSIPYRAVNTIHSALFQTTDLSTARSPDAPGRTLVSTTDTISSQLKLFGSIWSLEKVAYFVHVVISRLLLIFPILFLIGLVPQMDTVLVYLLEQVDIHIFGGSGAANLWSVCFSLLRTSIVYGIVLWFCLAAIETGDPYHYLFSVFWALQVSLCFLLSRLPSNLSLYATLFPCSMNWEQFGQQLRALVSELFHFSCFSRLRNKTGTGVSTPVVGRKRRCRPRWPWSKNRKSRVGIANATLEPAVWWRAWLPLLSNVGEKSTTLASATQSGVTDRLLGFPLRSAGDVSTSTPFTLIQPISQYVAKPFRSSSLNELSTIGEGLISSSIRSTFNAPVRRAHTAGSLPVVSDLSGRTQTNRIFNASIGDRFGTSIRMTKESRRTPSDTSPPNCPEKDENECPPGGTQSVKSIPDEVSHVLVNGCDDTLDRSVTCSGEHVVMNLPLNPKLSPLDSLKRHRATLTESETDSDSKQPGIPQSKTDPLPGLIRTALTGRLKNDLNCCIIWLIAVSTLHATPLLKFVTKQSIVQRTLLWTVVVCGTFLHYVWPNLRKSYPWLCLAHPPVAPHAYGELIRWEIGYYWFCWFERNILIPSLTVLSVTRSTDTLVAKFGSNGAAVLILLTSMKLLRNGFTAPSHVFVSLFFTDLLFTFDFHQISETLPLNYFFVSILLCKIIELIRKLHFVYIYTAPFRITCGSVFHAIAQIAFIPHVLFMLGNCVFSTILSSPLEPFLASAVFITSYVRPIKFWEVEHRTERMETTNMSLAAQLRGPTEQQVMLNSNAIFYERLSRNLQLTLAGDIQLGRLGGLTVAHGDVFILSSDDLNLVIHIVEVGNGLVTFQLRGLEFVGTYCHDHETEALRRTSHNDDGFCCCNPGHYPGLLSLNAALRMRCMTWQFIYGAYCVEGYRMTSHSADTVVQLNDFRKILVTRFVQCIIFYVTKLQNLEQRLQTLTSCLQTNNFFSESHFDLDPVFMRQIDEDFDDRMSGVTRRRFVQFYHAWICYCLEKQSFSDTISSDPNSALVTLCYALSILGRRCMGGVQAANFDVGQVLRGIHDIFKGDIHVLTKDDWVLADLELLQTVITPAMRIALKLYQDNFLWASEMTHVGLYSKILHTEKNFVICHETDPQWRFAVLNDAHNLFSIRLMGMDSDNVYRFVQLTKGKLNFAAVKINPECVRGLWAGQQREQIFVRNTNHERGSIQGAQHVLRNLVNSSCDPPIGYPIYVSPLLTSFAGTNPLYTKVAGPWFSFLSAFRWLHTHLVRLFHRRASDAANNFHSGREGIELKTRYQAHSRSSSVHAVGKTTSDLCRQATTDGQDVSPGPWPAFAESYESVHQKKTRARCSGQFTTLAALVHQQGDSDTLANYRSSLPRPVRVKIVDINQILNDKLNKLSWPSEEWRTRCLTLSVCSTSFYDGLEGDMVHQWTPCNPDTTARSFCHRTIRLLGFPGGPPLLDGYFVAIYDEGVVEVASLDEATTSASPTFGTKKGTTELFELGGMS